MRNGFAIVLSAPSGAGKTTLLHRLRAEFPDVRFSVSCTTRPKRPDEEDGRDYFFISREEFIKMRESGGFAEWAEVHGNLYGTPLAPVNTMLGAGQDVLFDIDVQGAAQIRSTIPDACFIFILPPSMRELERRLATRGVNDVESLKKRLANALAEMREAFWYDALIVNDNLDQAYDQLRAAYMAAALAPGRNRAVLEKLLEEAQAYHG